jgi:hypothetical protein
LQLFCINQKYLETHADGHRFRITASHTHAYQPLKSSAR